MPALTTTSYAILGLLSLRPYTAYELAAQSRRSLRFAWPTAESRLYAEPKRLAAEGLIEVDEQPAGPVRTRQLYRITPAGRAALREWLRSQPASPRPELEILLRVLFADAGDPADLLGALAGTREQVRALYADGQAMLADYVAGEVVFPERLHLNVLWAIFVRDLLQLVLDWTDFAEQEVESWSRSGSTGVSPRSRSILEALVAGEPVLPARRTV